MRNKITLNFRVGQRTVSVTALDSVGVEDCYDNAVRSVLHRFATAEDLTMPVPREIKDFIIKTNLFV